MTQETLFGTDGMRGVANVDPMTPEMAMRLGCAPSPAHFRQPEPPRRASSSARTRASPATCSRRRWPPASARWAPTSCCAGRCRRRASPSSPRRCAPTPAWSSRRQPQPVPGQRHQDLRARRLQAARRASRREIEELMACGDELDASAPHRRRRSARRPRSRTRAAATSCSCKATFPERAARSTGCASSSTAPTAPPTGSAPAVFEELGAEVIAIGVKPDGKQHQRRLRRAPPGARCARRCEKHGADLGIALDGDADRVIICDEHGEVVDGDAIMALVRDAACCERDELAKQTLVTTVMSNLGLERARRGGGRQAGAHRRSAIATSSRRCARGGYNFGGEQSGHLVFLDHVTTGDGIVAALAGAGGDAGARAGRCRSSRKVMTRYPQVLVNVKVDARRSRSSALPGRAARSSPRSKRDAGRRRARAGALLAAPRPRRA